MTLQQLEYVLAVDRFRHFAKAAEYCRVTQPTLSAMIQKLEEELGVKLFDRNRQPVCPTQIGEKILIQARLVLEHTSRVADLVREEEGGLRGTFRLGVLPTIAPYLLPCFFPRLMEAYPELDVRITEMRTSQVLQSLRDGKIDAGIIANQPQEAGCSGITLFYESFYGYVSREENLFKKDKIRTSDITGERLWLLDEGHCFRDQLVRFCQLEKVRVNQMAYHLGSMETFMRMVESGKGITFIPELAVQQLSDGQKELVRPFAVPCPTRQIVLVVRQDFIRYRILNVLKEAIQKSIPKEMLVLKPLQQLV